MAYNNANMLRIAQIGAMTRPQFRNMPTLDLGGAVDNFFNARDAADQRAQAQEKKQQLNAYAEALTQAHPEDAARIAADPLGYAAMLDDNAKAERDQQYKLDYLAKQNANAMGLAAYQNNLRNIAAKEEKAQRAAQLDEALASGLISQEQYNMAKQRELLGDIVKGTGIDTKGAMDLRKEFQAKNKDYYTVGDAYGKIIKVSEKPSAAGDLSLIFNYMKMLDPNSVVRESEFQNAENARAWFDQNNVPTYMRLAYEQAKTGNKLLPEQRADFINQAQNLFNAQAERFNNEAAFYTNIANRSGIDPQDVVYNPYKFSIAPVNQSGNDPLNLR